MGWKDRTVVVGSPGASSWRSRAQPVQESIAPPLDTSIEVREPSSWKSRASAPAGLQSDQVEEVRQRNAELDATGASIPELREAATRTFAKKTFKGPEQVAAGMGIKSQPKPEGPEQQKPLTFKPFADLLSRPKRMESFSASGIHGTPADFSEVEQHQPLTLGPIQELKEMAVDPVVTAAQKHVGRQLVRPGLAVAGAIGPGTELLGREGVTWLTGQTPDESMDPARLAQGANALPEGIPGAALRSGAHYAGQLPAFLANPFGKAKAAKDIAGAAAKLPLAVRAWAGAKVGVPQGAAFGGAQSLLTPKADVGEGILGGAAVGGVMGAGLGAAQPALTLLDNVLSRAKTVIGQRVALAGKAYGERFGKAGERIVEGKVASRGPQAPAEPKPLALLTRKATAQMQQDASVIVRVPVKQFVTPRASKFKTTPKPSDIPTKPSWVEIRKEGNRVVADILHVNTNAPARAVTVPLTPEAAAQLGKYAGAAGAAVRVAPEIYKTDSTLMDLFSGAHTSALSERISPVADEMRKKVSELIGKKAAEVMNAPLPANPNILIKRPGPPVRPSMSIDQVRASPGKATPQPGYLVKTGKSPGFHNEPTFVDPEMHAVTVHEDGTVVLSPVQVGDTMLPDELAPTAINRSMAAVTVHGNKSTADIIAEAQRKRDAMLANEVTHSYIPSPYELDSRPDWIKFNQGMRPDDPVNADESTRVSMPQSMQSLLSGEQEATVPGWKDVLHGSRHGGIQETGFSTEKIGTGEGAQAQGYGHYTAESPEVARSYKTAGLIYESNGQPTFYKSSKDPSGARGHKLLRLNDPEVALDYFTPGRLLGPESDLWWANNSRAAKNLYYRVIEYRPPTYEGDVGSITTIASDITGNPLPGAEKIINHPPEPDEKHVAKMINYRAAPNSDEHSGYLYKVKVPADDELLNLDTSLDRQPRSVQKALMEVFDARNMRDLRIVLSYEMQVHPDTLTGHDVHNVLLKLVDEGPEWQDDLGYRMAKDTPQQVSALLDAHGVPGLRYLDAVSREYGKGTYNYVIWNDERIPKPEVLESPKKAPRVDPPGVAQLPSGPMKSQKLLGPGTPPPPPPPKLPPRRAPPPGGFTSVANMQDANNLGVSLADWRRLSTLQKDLYEATLRGDYGTEEKARNAYNVLLRKARAAKEGSVILDLGKAPANDNSSGGFKPPPGGPLKPLKALPPSGPSGPLMAKGPIAIEKPGMPPVTEDNAGFAAVDDIEKITRMFQGSLQGKSLWNKIGDAFLGKQLRGPADLASLRGALQATALLQRSSDDIRSTFSDKFKIGMNSKLSNDIGDFMLGKKSWDQVANSNQGVMAGVREFSHNVMAEAQALSARLGELGAIPDDLETLRANGMLDLYQARRYMTYALPKGEWAKRLSTPALQERFTNGVKFILGELKRAGSPFTEEQVTSQLLETLNARDPMEALKNSGLGSPLKSLLARKDVPKPIREMLGEIGGVYRAAMTIGVQRSLVAKFELLEEISLNPKWSSDQFNDALGMTYRLPNHPSMGKAANRYVTQELMESIGGLRNIETKANSFLTNTLGFIKGNQVALGGLGPMLNNTFGNLVSGVSAGGLDITRPQKSGAALKGAWNAMRDYAKDPTGQTGLGWAVIEARRVGGDYFGFSHEEVGNPHARKFLQLMDEAFPPGEQPHLYKAWGKITKTFNKYRDVQMWAGEKFLDNVDRLFRLQSYMALREKFLADVAKRGDLSEVVRLGLLQPQGSVSVLMSDTVGGKVTGFTTYQRAADEVRAMSTALLSPAGAQKAHREVLEAVARLAALRINQSFMNPTFVGSINQTMRQIPFLSAPYGTAAFEGVRTNATTAARMLSEPDLRMRLLATGIFIGAVAGIMKALSGVDQDSINKAYASLPEYQRYYRPASFALPWRDSQNRVQTFDVSRMFDPFRLAVGHEDDALWKKVLTNLVMTPFDGGAAERPLRQAIAATGFLRPSPMHPQGTALTRQGIVGALDQARRAGMFPGALQAVADALQGSGVLPGRSNLREPMTPPQAVIRGLGSTNVQPISSAPNSPSVQAQRVESKGQVKGLWKERARVIHQPGSLEEKQVKMKEIAEEKKRLLQKRADKAAIRNK